MILSPPDGSVAELNVYPLKSCAQIRCDSVEVGALGFAHDRRWLVVDAAGRFLTGRECPRLVAIVATPSALGLRLHAPDRSSIEIERPSGEQRREVTIWSSSVSAARADQGNAWLSAWLERDVALVYMDSHALRASDPRYSRAGDLVSFADGFPILLTTQASLRDLNARLAKPVGMARFRANIVVASALEAYCEDQAAGFDIGGMRFDQVKPCARCVFITLDEATLKFDPEREPLRTLSTYRRPEPGKILFGVNLIARDYGTLQVGSPVKFLD